MDAISCWYGSVSPWWNKPTSPPRQGGHSGPREPLSPRCLSCAYLFELNPAIVLITSTETWPRVEMFVCFSAGMGTFSSVCAAVFLFCCSEATAGKKEGRMGKFLLYFTLIWGFIHPDCHWRRKMILPPRTPEVFRGRQKAPFAFNCFHFILYEQWLLPWNSRQSVRLVRKVRQTSNKGNMKALCGLGFFCGFFQIPAVPQACKRVQKP